MCSSFAVETPEIKSGRSSDMENLNMRCTKKVGRVNTHQSSYNGLTYNNLYISGRFPASFLSFLVLPEELRGREPSELEQYALLVEVPHGLVYHPPR